MKNKPHKSLKRLSLLDGKALVSSAITGASFHLYHIKKLLDSYEHKASLSKEDSWPEELSGNETNQIHWLLRGFFWELVGAFDLLLQWCNERFVLGLEEHEIKWSKIKKINKAGRDQKLWDEIRSLLQKTWDSEWYFEIRTYRNFSHKSFLILTALVPKNGAPQLFLEHAREGQSGYEDLRNALPKYLEEFRSLVLQITKTVHDYESNSGA